MTTKPLREIRNNTLLKKRLAKGTALQCFRNTHLENLHAGMSPSSETGDFSDVNVVSPYGEIPLDPSVAVQRMLRAQHGTRGHPEIIYGASYLLDFTAAASFSNCRPDFCKAAESSRSREQMLNRRSFEGGVLGTPERSLAIFLAAATMS
jgi:hypothetical protein